MRFSILFLTIVWFSSCSNDDQKPVKVDTQLLKEQLVDANKEAAEIESTQIDGYVKRRKLAVKKSPTGLRYVIYHDEEGESVKDEQIAVVEYKVSLLNGKECYNTEEGPEEFTVGHDYVESGLHEGIKHLSIGDKAIMIIPSHLAHGLAGDFEKIPIRSTIVYDIKLVAIK